MVAVSACSPHVHRFHRSVTSNSMKYSASIFNNEKLKPGIYKIQNIVSQTYVDIREHTKELCCRPVTLLDGKGLWEIHPSTPGYTIRRFEPGNPNQFCFVLHDLGHPVPVAPFPVAWRVEIVCDERYPGCEYVRFFWGTTNSTRDLRYNGSEEDFTPVQLVDNRDSNPCRIWKLVPVKLDTTDSVLEANSVPTPGPGLLPQYDGNTDNQLRTRSRQTTEINDDDEYETTVVETTVTTTTTKTVTTRKKHRAEGE